MLVAHLHVRTTLVVLEHLLQSTPVILAVIQIMVHTWTHLYLVSACKIHSNNKMSRLNSHILTIAIGLIICMTFREALAENEVFKINKLNLVWHKAQHSLGPSKLKDLKTDLLRHEEDELSLKKMRAHNQDKDGLHEAVVRRKLLAIMTKYALDRYYDDIHPNIKDEHNNKQDNLAKVKSTPAADHDKAHLKAVFRDKRLDKLWKKAEQIGFSQEELMVLHDEFQHQQDKLDEHYEIMNNIEEEIEKKMKQRSAHENSIDHDSDRLDTKKPVDPSDKKARLDENVHQVLKEKYKDIKKNIDKLHEKIIEPSAKSMFKAKQVNDLWIAAMNANFTTEELQSLKDELEHYQSRIDKLQHFENELERDHIIKSKQSSSNAEDTDSDSKHIKKRVQELTQKVDKTHKTIENKIKRKREEL